MGYKHRTTTDPKEIPVLVDNGEVKKGEPPKKESADIKTVLNALELLQKNPRNQSDILAKATRHFFNSTRKVHCRFYS